jgi:DNA processing protein
MTTGAGGQRNTTLDVRSARGLMALQHLPRIGRARAIRAGLRGDLPTEIGLQGTDHQVAAAYEWADQEVQRSNEAGVDVIAFFDKSFPSRLSGIADPPAVLFVRGNIDLLAAPSFIAVVGTRDPSPFGAAAARSIASLLAEKGWGILSGLARGIDTIAHWAAIEAGAPTVAVLGCGLDRIYPRENGRLADAILSTGGALVSELPLGTPPLPRNLVARDRLQSGLAVAVVLAQSGIRGGAMHTARFAAEQGRPILCPVPNDATEKSEGLSALLEVPSRALCETLPAWREAESLCRRLSDRPLARPLTPETAGSVFDRLEAAMNEPLPGQQSFLVPEQVG